MTKKTSQRGRGRPAIELEKVALLQETYLGLLRLGKTEIEISAVPGMVCWDTGNDIGVMSKPEVVAELERPGDIRDEAGGSHDVQSVQGQPQL